MEGENKKSIVRADDTASDVSDSLAEERPVPALEKRKDYDISEKELEDYPDVFADIINALVYQGSDIVKPENLRPATVETRYLNLDGKLRRQTEDIAKYEVINDEAKILFLLANQSAADSRMILRKCGYTGGYYRSQYNGQTNVVCPVMELVLYWGEEHWGSAGSIRRFFRKKGLTEEAWKLIDNEKIHVFEMRHLPKETIQKFTSDMRIILEFLSDGPDENCFTQKIEHVWAVRELLILLLGNDRYRKLEKGFQKKDEAYETEEGECTMRDWIGEAWDKGIEQGIAQGMAKGVEVLISTYHEIGMTFEETAEKLKEKFGLADAEIERDMKLYW